jgi:hypothetical protein
MSAEEYAKFLQATGHRVIKTQSAWWYNVIPRVYRAFPFHRPLNPAPSEIIEVLSAGALAVRYACPIEKGHPSYMIVCTDKNYALQTLNKSARKQTRQGLQFCDVRRLSFTELRLSEAMEMNGDTLVRQGRTVPAQFEDYWNRFYSAAKECAAMEIWGAFAGNELAAYLVECQIEDCMEMLVIRSRTKHLAFRPNNALLYACTQNALSRPDITVVSAGFEPAKGYGPGQDHFKESMGFEKIATGQRIELHRLAAFFLRGRILSSIQRLTGFLPDAALFNKIRSTLTWYAEQPS